MSATGLQEGASPPSPRSFALAHRRPKHSFVGCSLIKEYDILGKLGEGTFGEVYRATCKRTGKQMALKKIIMHNEKDGFPITALREIKLLKLLSHKNVLSLQDMAVEHPPLRTTNSKKQKRPIMYMVTPYMDHDLSGMLDNPGIHLTIPQIKCYMLQLLEGVRYLHDNHILHRDMKAANLLISNKGILQIADFGLARHYEGGVPLPGKGGGETKFEYTSLVVTRWYRPPELLMQFRRYTTAIDMWGVGCVFGEMLHGKPILAGESDAHQLDIIFDLCGSPTDDNMPGWRDLPGGKALKPRPRSGNLSTRFARYGSGAVSLLRELLKLDYKARVNAMDALKHPYFQTAPHPILPGDLPTFEESHELDRRKFQDRSKVAALPPAPKGGDVGRGPGGDNNAGAGFNHRDNYSNRNGSANGGGRYPRGDSRHGPPNDERVPAWRLPPRPPPPAGNGNGASDHGSDGYRERERERDRDRGPPPRSRGGGGGPPPPLDRAPPGVGGGGGDTYFPDYKRDDRKDDRRRPPRDDRDDRHAGGWDRRRGPEYDDRPRNSRSRSPATHGWDRDRERDRDYRR